MMFRVGKDVVEAEESWFTVGRSADRCKGSNQLNILYIPIIRLPGEFPQKLSYNFIDTYIKMFMIVLK